MGDLVTAGLRRAQRVLASVVLIVAVALVDHILVHVNTTTVALTLLLAVLGIAARWGLLESMIASLAGMLCFNYFFLPPVGKWTIAEPQNWVALFAFLVTAVVASQLSSKAKSRAAEAASRQHEMEKLYLLGRSLLLMDSSSPFGKQIVSRIAEVFGFHSVALYDREADATFWAGQGQPISTEGELRDAAIQGSTTMNPGAEVAVLPFAAGGGWIGSLALPAVPASNTALRAIANLAAIALEHARGQEVASRSEAARQSEELKSAMLDALAHEFKTPLTSIKAAVSSILNDSVASPLNSELLEIVDEETDRLTSLVNEAIQMARIEAGQVELRRIPQSANGLIRRAVARMTRNLESKLVEVRADDNLPPVLADPDLILIVFRQLLDNAVKYSDLDSPISIRAVRQEDFVVIGVADRGPGISLSEQARVFEKFYRGREARERIPGAGMGLAIVREIISAHNGSAWVESQPGRGSEFLFSLPLAQEADQR